MYNFTPKLKSRKPITDENKMKQIKSWNDSEISKQIPKLRSKKVHFDATTRFLDACINFYKDEINDLLEDGVDVNCSDKDHLTAIHQACINSRIDLVDYLLTKNADINVCDKEGWTPLHIAADIGSYELAKYLIDHGARLDVANYDGDLPIMFVNETEYPDLKNYLQKEMDKRRINSEECSNYERAIMLEDVKKWITNNKYDPPIDRINKSTPVHVAASKNYVEVLSELLPLLSNDDINAQDIDGWTALHAAAHWGHREACTILINGGADLDICTRANETIMDIIDPDLKIVLSEEIKKVKMEKEKLRIPGIRNEILNRSDNVNRRSKNVSRSSIVRQSVEWKQNFQMKDPASERETLVKAGLNSDSSGIVTIEECDERIISPQKDNALESSKCFNDKFENSSTIISELNDFKASSSTDNYETDCDKRDIQNRNHSKNLPQPKDKPSEIIQLSNGNNLKIDLSLSAQEIQITDSNNGALMNEFGSDTNSDSELLKSRDMEVRLRPKSTRDAISLHRSTLDRTSLVMAPAKSNEAEVMRREKARRVRSIRRSTQAIDLGGVKEVDSKKLPITKDVKEDPSANVVKKSESFSSDKKLNDSSKTETKSCDIVKIEDASMDCSTKTKTKEMNKNGDVIDKSSIDSVDANSVIKRNPLKYQVSCPTSHQSPQSFTYNRARLTISNTIKDLIKKVPTDTQKSVVTNSNSTANSTAGRGLNVNKCIEAGDFDNKNELSKDFPTKSTKNYKDVKSKIQNSENNFEDRDCGSFVARPVFGNANEVKLSEYHETKYPLSVSVDKDDNYETSTSDSSDINCLKDENQISKSILTRMLNDQTTKQELLKEISVLTEELKETKEKIRQSESNSSFDHNAHQSDSDDKGTKLEMEVSKLRDENKKLKSQNEALLRVISRIQQELESFRKVPLP